MPVNELLLLWLELHTHKMQASRINVDARTSDILR
jgi:hypothetical protein